MMMPRGVATCGDVAAAQIDVVMAVCNGAAWLEPTLRSLLAQTMPGFRLTLVDDGSRDGSGDIARSFTDARISVIRSENRGVSAARNLGLAAATAPYVLFLDADDLLHHEALVTLVGALDANPQCIAAFGQHWKIDASGKPLTSLGEAMAKPLPEKDTLWSLLAKNVVVNGGALAIRTYAARAAGGYDESLAIAEDWEFWCRLACLGDFHALPDRLVLYYRRHSEGADFQKRSGASARRYPAIDTVFANPLIQRRFSAEQLAERRRKFEMDVYWGSVRNLLLSKRPAAFAAAATLGLARYPESLFRLDLAARLVRQVSGVRTSPARKARRA